MVKQVADFFINKNYPQIAADLAGYSKPDILKWQGETSGLISDVTSKQNGSFKIIVEVETEDSVDDQHTEDQWKLFAAYAKRDQAEFLIVVPGNSKRLAEKRKTELGIDGKIVGV